MTDPGPAAGREATPAENRAYQAGQLKGLEIAATVLQEYAVRWKLSAEALNHVEAMRDGLSTAINLMSLKYPDVQN